MSDFLRSIRDFTLRFIGRKLPNGQNGSITVQESEFRGNARHFVRKSLREQQVIVRDEAGAVSMVLGSSGHNLFPQEDDDPDLPMDLAAEEYDPDLYDSWLS